MRSKDTLLRLHRFHVEEKRRQVGDIEMMMADFRRKQDDLDQQIAYEEQKTGVSDPAKFNYSMTAKSIRGRRENLVATIADLQAQLDRAPNAGVGATRLPRRTAGAVRVVEAGFARHVGFLQRFTSLLNAVNCSFR